MAASRPQKYADGGMPSGQPALSIQYADGGKIGTSNQDTATLNTSTAGDNFADYMRQQAVGAEGQSPAMSIQYAQPQAGLSPGYHAGNDAGLAAMSAPKRNLSTDPLGPVEARVGQGIALAVNALPGVGGVMSDAVNSNLNKAYAEGNSPYGGLPNPKDIFKAVLGGSTDSKFGVPALTQTQMDNDTTGLGAVNTVDAVTQPTATEAAGDTAGLSGMTGDSSGGGGGRQLGPGAFSGAQGANDHAGGADRADGGIIGRYADGGQIAPQQLPVQQGPNPTMETAGLQPQTGAPAAPGGDPMHPAIAALHVQNQLANPQVMQAIVAHLVQAMDAGHVNPQQLQMMGQLAQSAMQHPELWPKLRQFAMQIGLPDAKNLPEQFDQKICMALLAASQAHQHGDTQGAFKNGGMLHGAGTGTSDSIPAHNTNTGQPVKLSNGEYIIPADVVATKGKEFFDNIVRKYHTPAAMQAR